jgi:hypothetical protein
MGVPSVRCRQISESDIDGVAVLLAGGFSRRKRQFWLRALSQLRDRKSPVDFPKYGYLLESNGVPVGAILLIFSALGRGAAERVRCNVSSWYVEPEFRGYASMLVSQALRHKNVTYVNVSPAPNTWPIIEAQGFSRYCDGIYVAAPILNLFSGCGRVDVVKAGAESDARFDPADRDLLLQHAELGCISVWCVTDELAHPFVFRPRVVKGIPCVQLIYCREVQDFVRFAGPLGWYLAVRGRPLVIVDSNAPIAGLAGVFRPGRMPKYFKGPEQPRLGDLAFTEHAMLGV